MYGQQFSNPVGSATKWIFFGFFGIIMMAILLGADIKDAKWFNADIATAEANRINVETAHQQATYELQERLSRAQTDAEIQEINRQQKLLDAQYDHDIQALTQDLNHREISFKTWMTLITLMGTAITIAVVVNSILWVWSKALANLRSASVAGRLQKKYVPPVEMVIPLTPEQDFGERWNEDDYRKIKIEEAREKERAERQRKLNDEAEDQNLVMRRIKSISDPGKVEPGKYNNLPLGV